MTLKAKEKELEKILKGLRSALIAFSGGVDSSYLLYKAKEALGKKVLAVTALSETYQPDEAERARRVAAEIGAEHIFIQTRELDLKEFAANPPQRCFYCKKELFTRLKELAGERNLAWVCDGANADDLFDFRPGHRAARMLGVKSPLLEAGLGKEDIRNLSREAGLKTWNLPAAACLASRIPYGEEITEEKLKRIAAAEKYLKDLGFELLRVRLHNNMARIEVEEGELEKVVEKRKEIAGYFKALGFTYVSLDLEGYRSGSMNEALGPEEKEKAPALGDKA